MKVRDEGGCHLFMCAACQVCGDAEKKQSDKIKPDELSTPLIPILA